MTAQNSNDEIHVMPKIGSSPASPPRPTSPASPAGPVKSSAEVSQAPKDAKPPRSWMKIVIGIVLIALLAASGYFLYNSYRPQPAPAPVVNEIGETEKEETAPETVSLPSTTPPAATPDITVATPDEEPSFATPEVIADIVPSSREEFKHGIISKITLDMITSNDSDEDGLTDIEEKLLETNLDNPDSDDDTFADGQEVINLYDPIKAEGAKLDDSDLIKTYSNESYKYTVLYPSAWLARSTDKAGLETVFTSENNEFVSVWVEENKDNLPLIDWYQKQAPDVDPNDLIEFINKKGHIGLKSADGFTIYFSRDRFVYIIHYNIGLKEQADYPSIYHMMVESFNFIANQKG